MKKVLFMTLFLLPTLAQAQSPFDGTWKVDPSRLPKTQASQTNDSVLLLQNGVFQCISCDPKISIKADGTDQTVPLQQPYNYDMMSIKVVDDKTTESIAKKDGKILYTTRNTISADGKTSTVEFLLPDPGKQPSPMGRLAYDRVAEGPSGSHAVSGTWRRQNMPASGNANPPTNAPTYMITLKGSTNGLTMSGSEGSYDAKFDGKDYPVTLPGNIPEAVGNFTPNTISLTKVNERSIDETAKRDGRVLSRDSPDGIGRRKDHDYKTGESGARGGQFNTYRD